jgi:membrane protease YdiL (CAAX protease family)
MIIALIVLIFILVTSFPGAFGSPPPVYQLREIYQFEPWGFELDGLEVLFPSGGVIVPLYCEDKQEAVLITGAGKYVFTGNPPPVEDPAGIYLVISQALFESKRGDTIFIPVENEAERAKQTALAVRQPGLPVHWQRAIPLSFTPYGHSLFYYFITSDGEPVLPPVLAAPPGTLLVALLIYILFFMVILLVLNIFSLDHHPSRYWKFIHCARPGTVALVMVPAAAGLALGGELLPRLTGWPDYAVASGYLLTVAILLFLSKYRQVDFLDFGLQRDSLRHGYLLAGAAALIFLIMARDIPQNVSLRGMDTLVEYLLLFFLAALGREMIWRGFIQTTLGRRLGSTTGLLMTAALAGLLHLALIFLTEPWLLSYPFTYVELAVLVPGTALVLGFLYLRTENLLSCAFLHSLILFLPRIIVS